MNKGTYLSFVKRKSLIARQVIVHESPPTHTCADHHMVVLSCFNWVARTDSTQLSPGVTIQLYAI